LKALAYQNQIYSVRLPGLETHRLDQLQLKKPEQPSIAQESMLLSWPLVFKMAGIPKLIFSQSILYKN
jgi:hypothetical protein